MDQEQASSTPSLWDEVQRLTDEYCRAHPECHTSLEYEPKGRWHLLKDGERVATWFNLVSIIRWLQTQDKYSAMILDCFTPSGSLFQAIKWKCAACGYDGNVTHFGVIKFVRKSCDQCGTENRIVPRD